MMVEMDECHYQDFLPSKNTLVNNVVYTYLGISMLIIFYSDQYKFVHL